MDIINLVGNTPVIEIDNIYLKLEYLNPTGSHKDRIALYMLKDAESKSLKKGNYVIEYTSGNTGISVTWVSRLLGYKPLILVPENIVKEKINFIKTLGGEIRLVHPQEDGHLIAEKLSKKMNGVFLHQDMNPANFKAHYETTGPELYSQAKNMKYFVMGAGTGGTIYGISKYLKEKDEKIKTVLLVPKGSVLQEEFFERKDEDMELLEGFSYHSYPELLKMAVDENLIDEIKLVDSRGSIEGVKALLSKGIPAGFTSGANYYHASRISKEKGEKVATLVADSIIRYPSLMHLIH